MTQDEVLQEHGQKQAIATATAASGSRGAIQHIFSQAQSATQGEKLALRVGAYQQEIRGGVDCQA